jgi:hypothetical protein
MIQLEESRVGVASRLTDLLKSNLGFAALTAGLFALAFASMSWHTRGLPRALTPGPIAMERPMARVAPAAPEPVVAYAEPNVRPSERKGWTLGVPQDDKSAGRNLMRLTAIQAANAYAHSPCDRAAKAAFIVAASTFIKSYAAGDDARVREAMQTAFSKGGVSKHEFPSDTHAFMASITPGQEDADALCAAGRRADAR